MSVLSAFRENVTDITEVERTVTKGRFGKHKDSGAPRKRRDPWRTRSPNRGGGFA